jgi:very-short-patch-repair endonuclease
MTETEWKLWGYLRRKRMGVKFKRQVPVGQYILDFFALEVGLAVEVDGGQHMTPEQKIRDQKRTEFLERHGITVVRYSNRDVVSNIEGVLNHLMDVIKNLKGSS